VSGLQVHVDDYLRLRRALGFKLEREGRLLPQLVAYLEAAGAKTPNRRAPAPRRFRGIVASLLCHTARQNPFARQPPCIGAAP
jgi:hypothetical protein